MSKITFTVSKSRGERPPRQSVAIPDLLATRHTALRGQDLNLGFDKEQEKQGRRWEAKMLESRMEKAESSDALLVADEVVVTYPREFVEMQTSEGLHLVS